MLRINRNRFGAANYLLILLLVAFHLLAVSPAKSQVLSTDVTSPEQALKIVEDNTSNPDILFLYTGYGYDRSEFMSEIRGTGLLDYSAINEVSMKATGSLTTYISKNEAMLEKFLKKAFEDDNFQRKACMVMIGRCFNPGIAYIRRIAEQLKNSRSPEEKECYLYCIRYALQTSNSIRLYESVIMEFLDDIYWKTKHNYVREQVSYILADYATLPSDMRLFSKNQYYLLVFQKNSHYILLILIVITVLVLITKQRKIIKLKEQLDKLKGD
jgi:hypothetical protein